MKKLLLFFVLILFVGISFADVHAQMRDQELRSSDYSGRILKPVDPSDGANLGNLFNMKMSHSYSVNFSSFGGQYQNLNAYTNTMQFFFSEKLTGRVDLSLLHSPFGTNMNGFDAQQNVQFILRNAELNYDISDNASIRLQVNQVPANYGFFPGYGYGPMNAGFSPFNDFPSSRRY